MIDREIMRALLYRPYCAKLYIQERNRHQNTQPPVYLNTVPTNIALRFE